MVITVRELSTTETITFHKGCVQIALHRKDNLISEIDFPLCLTHVSPKVLNDMYDVLAVVVTELKKYNTVEANDE